MLSIEIYFLIFISLSVAGWFIEVSCKAFEYRRFINRGFLIGPYCPIYGVGALLGVFLLKELISHPFAVFTISTLLCGIVEYLTGYAMEKLFHARWWDYSGRRFNLNGRVCADTLLIFGMLSVLCIYILIPALCKLYLKLPVTLLHTLCIILFLVFSTDCILSFKTLRRIRNSVDLSAADCTEALGSAVRAELAANGRLLRRTLNAFPSAKLLIHRLKDRDK